MLLFSIVMSVLSVSGVGFVTFRGVQDSVFRRRCRSAAGRTGEPLLFGGRIGKSKLVLYAVLAAAREGCR